MSERLVAMKDTLAAVSVVNANLPHSSWYLQRPGFASCRTRYAGHSLLFLPPSQRVLKNPEVTRRTVLGISSSVNTCGRKVQP